MQINLLDKTENETHFIVNFFRLKNNYMQSNIFTATWSKIWNLGAVVFNFVQKFY